MKLSGFFWDDRPDIYDIDAKSLVKVGPREYAQMSEWILDKVPSKNQDYLIIVRFEDIEEYVFEPTPIVRQWASAGLFGAIVVCPPEKRPVLSNYMQAANAIVPASFASNDEEILALVDYMTIRKSGSDFKQGLEDLTEIACRMHIVGDSCFVIDITDFKEITPDQLIDLSSRIQSLMRSIDKVALVVRLNGRIKFPSIVPAIATEKLASVLFGMLLLVEDKDHYVAARPIVDKLQHALPVKMSGLSPLEISDTIESMGRKAGLNIHIDQKILKDQLALAGTTTTALEAAQ